MLYQIVHDNQSKLWCGPAAIAAITGQPTSVITQMIRGVNGKTKVTGTSNAELLAVMRRLGYARIECLELARERMTLARFAKLHRKMFAGRATVVNVTDHYVVLAGRRFVDSSRRDPVLISDAPYRRAIVKRAWSFEKVAAPDLPGAPARKPRDSRMAKARALAAKHGVDVERQRGSSPTYWWVTCPALEHDDPHEGSQGCYDPGEVLDAVEDYVRLLTTGRLEAVTEPEYVAVALPPCPSKPADAVAYALEHHGPDHPVGIACSLSLLHGMDIRAKQVRGAAIVLVRSGRARWFRNKLVLQQGAA